MRIGLRTFFIQGIKIYQKWVSPFLGSCCRFYPSCSSYAIEAIAQYGCCYGSWLALRRLLKCHPWGSSGLDPVP